MVGSVLCRFDGQVLEVLESGNALRLPVKRGLLEPGYETLPKPFTPTELLNKVRALLQE